MKPQLKQADPAAIARFKQQVRLQPNGGSDDCWVLVHGSFSFRYRQYGGHRAAWMLRYGPIPAGMYIRRRCDNPRCVRPTHLFVATPKETTPRGDRHGKRLHPERVPCGEDHYNAKLTNARVRHIRKTYAQGKSIKALARQHEVCGWTVENVVLRKTWKHLP